ncbi:MAG TPA: hypothetical protein VKI64_05630 [Acidimicrobiales bacterium]|nr:hypothetical protein [Acidimicrobiales bacterium]
MRWFRRRRAHQALEPVGAREIEIAAVPRLERLLIAYAAQAHRFDLRLERLERRVEDVSEAADEFPSHADLLQVRLHSARVAAELARVAVELRGEMDRIAREAPSPRERRIQTLAEQILDISDSIDTLPRDLPGSDPDQGWAATA